jgi:hypothetical protein
MTPAGLPADELESKRAARRDAATVRIARLNRLWLVAQLAAIPFGAAGFVFSFWNSLFGPFGGVGFFALTSLAWAMSTAAAGGSAWLTFANWSVLPGVWRVVGLAPWSVLLMEVTFVTIGIA